MDPIFLKEKEIMIKSFRILIILSILLIAPFHACVEHGFAIHVSQAGVIVMGISHIKTFTMASYGHFLIGCSWTDEKQFWTDP